MRKLGFLVAIGAILATSLLASRGTALAATCAVPSLTYPTIQLAVNDPSCAVITVAPGVYNENVSVPRTVTINGAQAGVAVAGRVSVGPNESTVNGANPLNGNAVFDIKAPGVVIDGFTIKNALTVGAAYGVAVHSLGSAAVIQNNIMDGITTTDPSGNGTAQGVYLQGGPDNVHIINNAMRNIQSPRSAKGVLIGDNGGTNPSQNTLIQGNSITNITSTTRGAYGVSVGNTPNVSGLSILTNTITNLTGAGWVHAIGLEGDTPGVLVQGNDISGLNSATPDSIAVWFESNPSFASGTVTTNNFNVTAASFGIAVQPTLIGGPVNGTCNWWNSPTGPTTTTNPGGTGAQVSPKVTYQPWLIAPSGSCIGGNVATDKDQCKKDGWMTRVRSDGSTFKNQGDCIQYVNTGK